MASVLLLVSTIRVTSRREFSFCIRKVSDCVIAAIGRNIACSRFRLDARSKVKANADCELRFGCSEVTGGRPPG